MPNVADIHHMLDTALSSTALLLNLCLLYLVLEYSNVQMSVYKYILLVTCVSDIALATIIWIAQPVILFSDGYTVLHSSGFFARMSPTFDYVALSMVHAGVHANMVVLCTQFYCRYRFLCHRENKTQSLVLKIFVFPAPWCLTQSFASFWFNYAPDDYQSVIGPETLRNNSWPYDEKDPPFFSGSSRDQPRIVFFVSCDFLTAGLGYALMIWCEYRIVLHIRQLGNSISPQARQMHSDIHKALVALVSPAEWPAEVSYGRLCVTTPFQAAAPLFTSVIPIYFFMISVIVRASPGQISAFMVFGCSSITVANPITTMYFVKPYRMAVLRALRMRKRRVLPESTVLAGGLSIATTHVSEQAATNGGS